VNHGLYQRGGARFEFTFFVSDHSQPTRRECSCRYMKPITSRGEQGQIMFGFKYKMPATLHPIDV
jgi:hypothetical protein